MKIRQLVAVLPLTLGSCSGASTEPRTPMLVAATVHDTVAFTNVQLIPMTSSAVVPGRTVLVAGDRIVAVGATGQQRVPSTATVIDGKGRYLIPGLVDMHVHIAAADLATYVSYGITSVRNMWGTPYLLRSPHVDGAIIPADHGPAIYSASPGIDANPPSWPYTQLLEDPTRADSMVLALAADRWLFLKVYSRLSVESYDALAAAAHRQGIRFLGHVPFAVPVETVLARGQASIEHLSGYERALTGGRLGAIAWALADTLGAPTRAAAEFLERSSEFGTIQPGLRADLVLLRANPLDDVRNTRSIDGVMVRRRWFVRP